MSVVDITISTRPREGRDGQVSESQTLLGPRGAEEHGMLGIRSAEISDCSSTRRLRTNFQVTGLRTVGFRKYDLEACMLLYSPSATNEEAVAVTLSRTIDALDRFKIGALDVS